MTNRRNGTLYIGVTADLPQRVWQHKNRTCDGFTRRYGLDKLVWYEAHPGAESAITREKRLKKWNRAWKIELIENMNPQWKDLYDTLG